MARTPRPVVGFHARVKRDKRLAPIIDALEKSTDDRDLDAWIDALLDYSHSEYAEPPLPPASISFGRANRLQLYGMRAARNQAITHHDRWPHKDTPETSTTIVLEDGTRTTIHSDVLESAAFEVVLTRAKGEAARESGWRLSLQCDEEETDDDYQLDSDRFHREKRAPEPAADLGPTESSD